MSTIDKHFADRLIAGRGWIRGDSDNSMGDNPRCIKIVEYTTAWGGKGYGAVMESDHDPQRYERPTEYVQSPRVYWQAPGAAS